MGRLSPRQHTSYEPKPIDQNLELDQKDVEYLLPVLKGVISKICPQAEIPLDILFFYVSKLR